MKKRTIVRTFVLVTLVGLAVTLADAGDRLPLVVVGGKVTQMQSGDRIAGSAIVDTTSCSSGNVIGWNGSNFGCVAGGGSGGGITNSAGANVLMRSNGTNAVASSISDDGNKVTMTKQVGLVSAVPFVYRQMQITMADPTMEEGLWIEDNATGHVGSAGQNQAINVVLREQGTSDLTAADGTATGADIAVTQTRSAGTHNLTNTAILANATGGQTNFSFYSSHGQMIQTDAASFGSASFGGDVSVTGVTSGGGAASFGGNITAVGIASLGPSGGTGKLHTLNGNVQVRSPDADTYINLKNNSTGGRDWFFEASGTGGTDPNSIAIYDNTAGATRFKIDLNGNVYANVAMIVNGSKVSSGTGAPAISCSIGDVFMRKDGSTSTSFYVCTATNTWTAK